LDFVLSPLFVQAQGYILVYDITDRKTFEHIEYWLSEIRKNGKDFVPKIIVGNKSDLEDKRVVSTEEGQVELSLFILIYSYSLSFALIHFHSLSFLFSLCLIILFLFFWLFIFFQTFFLN
jgi:GTPase SAR1 family protein